MKGSWRSIHIAYFVSNAVVMAVGVVEFFVIIQ